MGWGEGLGTCRLNLARLFVSRVCKELSHDFCPGLSEFELEMKMPLLSVFYGVDRFFCLPFK